MTLSTPLLTSTQRLGSALATLKQQQKHLYAAIAAIAAAAVAVVAVVAAVVVAVAVAIA